MVEGTITHASLFSGIGAFDLAAYQLGMKDVFNCEINPFCRQVLDYWFPEAIGYTDVKTTEFTQYRGHIDILTGGFPCQSFSLAGLRRGTEDIRYLWPELLRAVHEIQPTYVIGENVFGILSMVEPGSTTKVGSQASLFEEAKDVYQRDGRFVTDLIREDLEREGYALQVFVLPACAVGAPHRRDRTWFIAKRLDANANGHGHIPSEAGGGTENHGRDIVLQQEERRDEAERSDGLSALSWDASDAERCGGLQGREHVQPKFPDGEGLAGDGMQRSFADTEGGRSGRIRIESEEERTRLRDVVLGERGGLYDERLPADYWRSFPTVEPVICGADDVISSGVARLTLPYPKWRAEAVKALGNSMVVVLCKEILRAIVLDIKNDRYEN